MAAGHLYAPSILCLLPACRVAAGNQTSRVSSAVIARVFLDPDLRLFDYCPKRLLNRYAWEMGRCPALPNVPACQGVHDGTCLEHAACCNHTAC